MGTRRSSVRHIIADTIPEIVKLQRNCNNSMKIRWATVRKVFACLYIYVWHTHVSHPSNYQISTFVFHIFSTAGVSENDTDSIIINLKLLQLFRQ